MSSGTYGAAETVIDVVAGLYFGDAWGLFPSTDTGAERGRMEDSGPIARLDKDGKGARVGILWFSYDVIVLRLVLLEFGPGAASVPEEEERGR